ncbi:MAG: lipid-A-disaccharide synthase [Alphaproteobacteria bacterium]|nr:lipid-A-disaccharide synthase [Alphaproteobacteria bacterium]
MPNDKPKIFIIAGEVSGDVLGASIMAEMKDIEFVGVGGEHMIRAGLKSIVPLGDLAVMGAVEVVMNARTLMHHIQTVADAIIDLRPDIVLTIDAPGFARSVIQRVRKSDVGQRLIADGMKFHHVVAPQVWAWRSKRAKKYAHTFDKLYAFFDFEVPYFTKYGLDTVAVGHPIADKLIGKYTDINNYNGTSEKIITLVPGSRMSEVKRLLPVFKRTAEILSANGYIDYKFIIPTVETTADYVKHHTANWRVPVKLISATNRYETYAKTYIAIVASGTVSAELAMLHIPAIVVYKMNPITTFLVRLVINTRWVSLVNILLRRSVYPELLGPNATAEKVLDAVQQLAIPSVRKKVISELIVADNMWRQNDASPVRLIAENIRHAIHRHANVSNQID